MIANLYVGKIFVAENSKVYNDDGTKKDGVTSNDLKLNKGFNNDSYLDMLKYRAFPSINSKIRNCIFMHDNAPIHIKKANKKDKNSLARNLIVGQFRTPILKWPPYSPDLNPLENIWALLNRAKNHELEERIQLGIDLPKNKKQMFEFLKICWQNLDNKIVKDAFKSFENRLKKVVENQGRNNFSTKSV